MRRKTADAPLSTRMPPLPASIDLGAWAFPPRVVVLDDWEFECEGVHYYVPAGFHSDAASIPRGTRWYTRWLGLLLMAALSLMRFGKLRSLRASVAHDWLYSERVNRRRADHVFRCLLKHDGIGLLGRWSAWAGVRLGGWTHY